VVGSRVVGRGSCEERLVANAPSAPAAIPRRGEKRTPGAATVEVWAIDPA